MPRKQILLRLLLRCNQLSNKISCVTGTHDRLLVDAHHRFPDNFEKLSPPILQLDEVEFYYSKDQRLFTGLNLSADLESRICIVCVAGVTQVSGGSQASPQENLTIICVCCI